MAMFFQTAAEWHAAMNDLPPALFLASVLFDLLGSATRRDTLKTAGFWSLIAGVIGAAFAVATGLRAEGQIEHGETVHQIMERHETWAIAVSITFALLAAWRLWRGRRMGSEERAGYLVAAVLGALGIVYTAHLGGTMVFRYAAGVPTPAIEAALSERRAPHRHAPGEEPEEGEHSHGPRDSTGALPAGGAGAQSGQAGSARPGEHTHPPGTPPHRHE